MTTKGLTLTHDEVDTNLMRTQFREGATIEQLALYFSIAPVVVLAVLRGEQTVHGNAVRIDDGLQSQIDRRLAYAPVAPVARVSKSGGGAQVTGDGSGH